MLNHGAAPAGPEFLFQDTDSQTLSLAQILAKTTWRHLSLLCLQECRELGCACASTAFVPTRQNSQLAPRLGSALPGVSVRSRERHSPGLLERAEMPASPQLHTPESQHHHHHRHPPSSRESGRGKVLCSCLELMVSGIIRSCK